MQGAIHKQLLMLAALAVLSACGGGGGGSGGGAAPVSGGGWTPGVFAPASSFAGQCAAPRPGVDTPGSVLTENNWLRSWTNDLYLWYDEVADQNPALFTTPDYFAQLKTFATTPSLRPKDRFHFTVDTVTWENFSQSGVTAGYGLEWAVVARFPPRRIVVAYTEPNSPATAASLARGFEVLFADGVDAVNDNTQAGVDRLNAALFPETAGETHTFTLRDLGGGTRTVTMQSANVTTTPVQNARTIGTASGTVGYLLFNDHIATAESELIDAVNALAGVTDLVLDIRYNGGGFLAIASELAFMVGGSARTSGRTFEQIVFNSKHPTIDPVTGQLLTPFPFLSTTQGFSVSSGQALPSLNLPRVFVLTGPGTCSASESVINGLRGVGVDVIQVGSTTCGKPYGFYPEDNCGTTYFSIQFKGVNAQGFGDYADGFAPTCQVADDFAHPLGDPAEARLAAALAFRAGAGCPAPSGFAPPDVKSALQALGVEQAGGVMVKPPWRENRLLRR